MGAIAFCLLLVVLAKTTWDFSKSPETRSEMLAEYKKRPFSNAIVTVWITCILMFALGIIIPDLGRIEIAGTGWHVIEVGLFGTIGIWVVGLFVDINKLDDQR